MRTPIDNHPSYGGPGWRSRPERHSDDVARGELWRPCGFDSETARLREVLISWPSDALTAIDDPAEELMLEAIDLPAIRRQTESIAALYESLGVVVHIARPATPPPPNYLFMRDLFFMTTEGAVVARPAAPQRAREPRFAAEALARIGIPIVATIRGAGLFEGADALWFNAKNVLIGVARRTNNEATRQLSPILDEIGARLTAIPLPNGVQHLLGVVNFLAGDLAAVRSAKAPSELHTFLDEHGVEQVSLEPSDEVDRLGAMNFVTIAPREIVMPTACPRTREIYQRYGIECHEVDVSEYLKAAGGPGCLTGILRRG